MRYSQLTFSCTSCNAKVQVGEVWLMPDFTAWFIGHCEAEDVDIRIIIPIQELIDVCASIKPSDGKKQKLLPPLKKGLTDEDKNFLKDFHISTNGDTEKKDDEEKGLT